jgi:hypothetical protein
MLLFAFFLGVMVLIQWLAYISRGIRGLGWTWTIQIVFLLVCAITAMFRADSFLGAYGMTMLSSVLMFFLSLSAGLILVVGEFSKKRA